MGKSNRRRVARPVPVARVADPLVEIRDARAAAAAARELEAAAVGRARAAGESWTSIARALGVTQQAASKRYGRG